MDSKDLKEMNSRIALLIILIFTCLFARAEKVEKIAIFTTTFMPVKQSANYPADEYLLDEMDLVLNELGRGLPGTLNEAVAEAQSRMSSKEGSELIARLKSSADGMVLAWSRKIKLLPAILINNQYVVYGVDNVDDGIAIFEEARE